MKQEPKTKQARRAKSDNRKAVPTTTFYGLAGGLGMYCYGDRRVAPVMRRLAAEDAAKQRERDRLPAAALSVSFFQLVSEHNSARVMVMALELVAAQLIISFAHHLPGGATVDDFIAGIAEDIRVEVERLQPGRVF